MIDTPRRPTSFPVADPPLRDLAQCVAERPTRISSAALMGGERELEIDHHGTLYRLKLTALGKLILTK